MFFVNARTQVDMLHQSLYHQSLCHQSLHRYIINPCVICLAQFFSDSRELIQQVHVQPWEEWLGCRLIQLEFDVCFAVASKQFRSGAFAAIQLQ